MFSKIRLTVFAMVPAAALLAQDPSPSPSPEAPSPSPSATIAPEPTAASPTPGDSPAVEATPTPLPTPATDVIPLEGQPAPESGAPLETTDLAPVDQAMPDEAFTDPNALVPDDVPPPPPSLASAVESEAQKARLLTVRYREVRVQVEKDPKVVSLLQQADNAKSEEARRAALREYYRLLFKKMTAVDKSLEAKCKQMEAAYIRKLAQELLEPTIPLNPPPTPEPLQ